MPNPIFITEECIVRQRDGSLLFFGEPWDGRHVAVQHCNDGVATDKDYAMLDGLPVLDEEPVVMVETLTFVRN